MSDERPKCPKCPDGTLSGGRVRLDRTDTPTHQMWVCNKCPHTEWRAIPK